MKDADADWLVYHQLTEGVPVTKEILAGKCGLGPEELDASLARLDSSCLIRQDGNSVRLLSFGEALIRNQLKYEDDLPFTLENGVIRAKRSCQEKK